MFISPLFSQIGDDAIAQKYLDWAIKAIVEGRWEEAEQALERGQDFADVSSDISYLLAVVRIQLHRPIGTVLDASERALRTDRWYRYDPQSALMLKAQCLIRVREYTEALNILASLPASADVAYLRLTALAALNTMPSFRTECIQAVELYPADPRFVRLFFTKMKDIPPVEKERQVLNQILKRLPALSAIDPALNYMAVPFIQNIEERRRMLQAYRATTTSPDLASLPVALEQGVVDDWQTIDELFQHDSIDVAIVQKVWNLLRGSSMQTYMVQKLRTFSGTLTEDDDIDSIPETYGVYKKGSIQSWTYDANQDGLPEVDISFYDGLPVTGKIAITAENSQKSFARPISLQEMNYVTACWERYPYIKQFDWNLTTYIPAPAAFPFMPVKLSALFRISPDMDFIFPKIDKLAQRITERNLVACSSYIERPGTLHEGTIERIELFHGIPQKATESYKGKAISILEFTNGEPSIQQLDADLDGRMETRRIFRQLPDSLDEGNPLRYQLVLEEVTSDWDGDGVYEYKELYHIDGTVEKIWNTNEKDMIEIIKKD
jgi:hypothetical protein